MEQPFWFRNELTPEPIKILMNLFTVCEQRNFSYVWVINYRHLFQSTKPLDSIFVIGILEHHIILKDGTITIAKLM